MRKSHHAMMQPCNLRLDFPKFTKRSNPLGHHCPIHHSHICHPQPALTSQKGKDPTVQPFILRQALYQETLAWTVRVSTCLVPLPFLGVVVATSATNSLYSGLAKKHQEFSTLQDLQGYELKTHDSDDDLLIYPPGFEEDSPKF